jgi:hypothetical protein
MVPLIDVVAFAKLLTPLNVAVIIGGIMILAVRRTTAKMDCSAVNNDRFQTDPEKQGQFTPLTITKHKTSQFCI